MILLYEVVGKAPGSAGDVASLAAETSPVDDRSGAEAVGDNPEAQGRADEGAAQRGARQSAGIHGADSSRTETPARCGN